SSERSAGTRLRSSIARASVRLSSQAPPHRPHASMRNPSLRAAKSGNLQLTHSRFDVHVWSTHGPRGSGAGSSGSTVDGFRYGPSPDISGLREQLTEDVRQDASVLVIEDLLQRIDAHRRAELLHRTVGRRRLHRDVA